MGQGLHLIVDSPGEFACFSVPIDEPLSSSIFTFDGNGNDIGIARGVNVAYDSVVGLARNAAHRLDFIFFPFCGNLVVGLGRPPLLAARHQVARQANA